MISSRRGFLRSTGALLTAPLLRAQNAMSTIDTPTLKIAYHESGNRQGFPVILLHGFPDDAHAYDDVASALAQAGHRILVPYLRGCGETRFRDASAPRMAEQAAIAQDLVDFADALGLARFALAGYDWGGRAAQVTAALHPERVRAAVFCGGYLIQNTIDKAPPAPPAVEKELWYQYYFNTERGRAGLAANRRAICKYLWQTWAPDWKFTDETYNRTAPSFDNPDFVDLVIHSYRHRIGNAPGEPRFLDMEKELAKRPKITCPAIILHGVNDPLARPQPDNPAERAQFQALMARRVVVGAGHFLPREKPEVVSAAMLELLAATH